MNPETSLAHFWSQGDALTSGVAIVLLLMSATSWYIMLGKLFDLWRLRRAAAQAPGAFWRAGAVVNALEASDASGIYLGIAREAEAAWQAYRDSGAAAGRAVVAGEYLGDALRQGVKRTQARLESGLSLLASIGATAPFIGLFGTVWGIHHALVALSGSTQVVLDKVAGPVGEALIMTAAGLFVAIPAVLAYNALLRMQRVAIAEVDAFGFALHAYLVGGIRPAQAADPASAQPPGAGTRSAAASREAP